MLPKKQKPASLAGYATGSPPGFKRPFVAKGSLLPSRKAIRFLSIVFNNTMNQNVLGGLPEELPSKNMRNYYFYKLVVNSCPIKIINKKFAKYIRSNILPLPDRLEVLKLAWQTGCLLYVYITPVTRMGIPALPVYTCRDIRAGAGNIRAGAGKFAGLCRSRQEHAAGMENLENKFRKTCSGLVKDFY